tara:strand:- start:971 stop:1732 length:762 start_codon:yes stop_codon:yes gene_type:complete
MKNTKPLGGVTLSPEFATALRDWRREREFRQDRINQAREEGIGEEEISISPDLPDPRGWWEYAVDPRGDGAPTDPNSNAPGSLDRTSDLNTDSLVLQNWWDDDSPGMDVRQIIQYQQMLKSEMYKGDWKSDIGDWFGYYTDEAWTPDIYVRTSMADYVPNMFNIFMDEDGDRLDPARTDGFWKRTGQTLGQGTAGYALMLGGGWVFLKFAPAFVEGGMEMLERVIGGSMEILFKFRSKWAAESMAVKALKGKT